MKRIAMNGTSALAASLMVVGLLTLVGCDNSGGDGSATTAAPSANATAPTEEGGVNEAMAEASGHDHSTATTLGPLEIEGQSVTVKVHGGMHAGETGHMDVIVEGDKTPATVRLWVGDKEAVGIRKGKAQSTGPNKFHGHTANPDPIPADAKLWVEVENEDGSMVTASYDLSLVPAE